MRHPKFILVEELHRVCENIFEVVSLEIRHGTDFSKHNKFILNIEQVK